MFNAIAVIGANFGDEGKGLVTDWICSTKTKPIVVLHNGGAQRAHTVTTPEGKEHIFRHIGAGAFVGADTYIAKTFVCNPIVFREEYEKLGQKLNKPIKIFVDTCDFKAIWPVKEMDGLGTRRKSCSILCYTKLVKALITETHNNKLQLLNKRKRAVSDPSF